MIGLKELVLLTVFALSVMVMGVHIRVFLRTGLWSFLLLGMSAVIMASALLVLTTYRMHLAASAIAAVGLMMHLIAFLLALLIEHRAIREILRQSSRFQLLTGSVHYCRRNEVRCGKHKVHLWVLGAGLCAALVTLFWAVPDAPLFLATLALADLGYIEGCLLIYGWSERS